MKHGTILRFQPDCWYEQPREPDPSLCLIPVISYMCWGAETDVPHTLLRQAGLHKHTVGDTGVQKLFKKWCLIVYLKRIYYKEIESRRQIECGEVQHLHQTHITPSLGLIRPEMGSRKRTEVIRFIHSWSVKKSMSHASIRLGESKQQYLFQPALSF